MLIKVISDMYFYIHHQNKLIIVTVIVNMEIKLLLNKDVEEQRKIVKNKLKKLNLIYTN